MPPHAGPLEQAAGRRHRQGRRRQVDRGGRAGHRRGRARAARDRGRGQRAGRRLAAFAGAGDAPGRSGPTFVERDLGDGLHHISIDPESALEEYVKDQLPRGVSDVLAGSRMFSYLVAATPGLRELLTVGKVWELAQPDRRTPGAHPTTS